MSRARPEPRSIVATHLAQRALATDAEGYAEELSPFLGALPGPHLTELLARHGSEFGDDALTLILSSPVAIVLAFKNTRITPADRTALTRGVLGLSLNDPGTESLRADLADLHDAAGWADTIPPREPVVGPGSIEAQFIYRALGLVHAGIEEPGSSAEDGAHPKWWLPAVYALLAMADLPEHMLTNMFEYVLHDERASAAVIRHPMAGASIWTSALAPWAMGDFSGRAARALIASPGAMDHAVVRSTLIAAGWLYDHGLLRSLAPVLSDDEWSGAIAALARRDAGAAADVIEQVPDSEIARLPGTVLQPLLASSDPDVHMVGLKAVGACQGSTPCVDTDTRAVDSAAPDADKPARTTKRQTSDTRGARTNDGGPNGLTARQTAAEFEGDAFDEIDDIEGLDDETNADADPLSFDGDSAGHPPLPL